MGFYFAGPGGYGPLIFGCRECQPDLVVIANQGSAVHDVKVASLYTEVVYRITGYDFGISGQKAQNLLPRLRIEAPEATYYSIANEIMPYDGAEAIRAVCDGYCEAMDVARSMNLKITVGNLNTGFPRLTNANLDAMTPMLRKAAEYAMPLALHIYNDGNPSANDVMILRVLADCAPGMKIIVEEYGALNNQMVGGEQFDTFLTLDDWLDDRVLGAAIFALCSPSWPTCDYKNDLPRLIQHVKCWK